jgi:Ca2+-binding RTX toxin-like protein
MKRLLLAAVVALLALPALAKASTCQRINHAVAVHMGGSSDVAYLNRVGDAIYDGLTPCDDATVHNVDTVFITDTSPGRDGNDFVGIDLSGGPFAPGSGSPKNGQVPEIKFELYLQHGDNFVLVRGSDGADTIRGGRTIDHNGHYLQGLNLNAADEAQPGKIADPDVVWQYATPYPNPPGNETLQIDGGLGPDTIDLSGGAGFDTPVLAGATLYGGTGDDHLTGGDGADTLFADPGNDTLDGGNYYDFVTYETAPGGVNVDLANSNQQDTGPLGKDTLRHFEGVKGSMYDDVLKARNGSSGLYGQGGNDLLVGGPYTDGLDGGSGIDTVSYERATQGVSVDLGVPGKNQTTGAGDDVVTDVENLVGSPYADSLTGDDGPNTIDGGGGADSLAGKGGADQLLLRDGSPDQATCGAGADNVTADAKGTDAIFSDCESIDFGPPPPAGQPTPTPTPTPTPAPGSGNPTPSPAGDHTPPVLSGLKLKGRTLSYKLSERATVKFRIQLKEGRKWKALRSQSKAGAAGLNKLRFSRRGRYRVTAVARDAAGNASKQRVVSFRVKR